MSSLKKNPNPYKQKKPKQAVVSSKKPKVMKDLHGYFDGRNNTVPTFFLLDFPTSAHFVRKIPPGEEVHYVQSTIKWHGKDLQLCSKQPLETSTLALPQSKYASHPKFKQLLQSHLQKCVRRCEGDKAASTTCEMLLTCCNTLLRRLPIITIEDAMLHEKFPLIVWMMAAHGKGVELTDPMKDFVVAYAKSVANCDIKDPIDMVEKEIPYDMKQIPKYFERDVHNGSFLYALQLRRSFGGMDCDLAMLDSATRLWMERFRGQATNRTLTTTVSSSCTTSSFNLDPYNASLPLVPFREVKSLRKEDWVLAAVDFHCTDIATQINDIHPFLDLDHIRNIIWEFRSSVNKKRIIGVGKEKDKVNEKDVRAWNLIKNDLDKISMEIINSV
eukprot:m.57392 g.57392  ORF g.57392 m.57392 type:complete len:386 (+) comp7825_c0_seq1:17-1174(+)